MDLLCNCRLVQGIKHCKQLRGCGDCTNISFLHQRLCCQLVAISDVRRSIPRVLAHEVTSRPWSVYVWDEVDDGVKHIRVAFEDDEHLYYGIHPLAQC